MYRPRIPGQERPPPAHSSFSTMSPTPGTVLITMYRAKQSSKPTSFKLDCRFCLAPSLSFSGSKTAGGHAPYHTPPSAGSFPDLDSHFGLPRLPHHSPWSCFLPWTQEAIDGYTQLLYTIGALSFGENAFIKYSNPGQVMWALKNSVLLSKTTVLHYLKIPSVRFISCVF